METPQKEKVEVFSVIGDEPARNASKSEASVSARTDMPDEDKVPILAWQSEAGGEKSWSVDKYQLMVSLSIVSVVVIMGGIVWLASGASQNNTSGANPLPTGELKFDSKKDVEGASTYQQDIPYPSVKGSKPLRPNKATTANPPSQSPKATPTTKPGSPTSTPAPTQSSSSNPTATPVPPTPTPYVITELKIEDITVGQGEGVKNGDNIRIHYTGTLTNGTKFDSSYDRGTPFETKIGVGQVIEGWDKGVVGMKVGGKRKLSIPADMAYGANPPSGSNIPPNSPLIFEMELIEIK